MATTDSPCPTAGAVTVRLPKPAIRGPASAIAACTGGSGSKAWWRVSASRTSVIDGRASSSTSRPRCRSGSRACRRCRRAGSQPAHRARRTWRAGFRSNRTSCRLLQAWDAAAIAAMAVTRNLRHARGDVGTTHRRPPAGDRQVVPSCMRGDPCGPVLRASPDSSLRHRQALSATIRHRTRKSREAPSMGLPGTRCRRRAAPQGDAGLGPRIADAPSLTRRITLSAQASRVETHVLRGRAVH